MQKSNAWKKAKLFNKLSDPLISKSCVKLGVSAGRGQKKQSLFLFWKERHTVRRICEIYQYNCAKNGKRLKIGTKETGTI